MVYEYKKGDRLVRRMGDEHFERTYEGEFTLYSGEEVLYIHKLKAKRVVGKEEFFVTSGYLEANYLPYQEAPPVPREVWVTRGSRSAPRIVKEVTPAYIITSWADKASGLTAFTRAQFTELYEKQDR